MFSPKDRETKKPRGFTFCQYRRKEDAAEAVKGMDKRVGYLTRDFSHTPLYGWTGGMSRLCEHTSEHAHGVSGTCGLCCGVNSVWPFSLGSGVLCLFVLAVLSIITLITQCIGIGRPRPVYLKLKVDV